MHVSGAKLLEFLRGERAAMPKVIHVIDRIPLTEVGKIFKPALKRLEVEDALSTALIAVGVDQVELKVVDDGRGIRLDVVVAEAASGGW